MIRKRLVIRLKSDYIRKLIWENVWSQNELARRVNVSKSTMSEVLSGKHGAGSKLMQGLLRVFPNETYFSLTKINEDCDRPLPKEGMPIKVAPYSHQIEAYNFAGDKLGIFKGGDEYVKG